MPFPNYARASAYACHQLEQQLSPDLRYHSLSHTRDDVVPAVTRLATQANVSPLHLLLLRTAAWYHDSGFIVCRDEHEAISARIAADVLPRFGYSTSQIAQIQGMIAATRLPQTPHTPLEALLADADLDSLGREDFLTTSLNLRDELCLYGTAIADAEWYTRQISFLQSHRYFSAAARELRDAQKQRNIALLGKLVSLGAAQTRTAHR